MVDIDDVMMNGYGIEKMKEDEEGQRHYIKINFNDLGSAILVSVIDAKDYPRNLLDIKVGEKYSIRKIKDDLVEDGFLYGGSNKYELTVYKKKKYCFLLQTNRMMSEQLRF